MSMDVLPCVCARAGFARVTRRLRPPSLDFEGAIEISRVREVITANQHGFPIENREGAPAGA